jgi:Bacterial capsule synthesis protein PGA_cap
MKVKNIKNILGNVAFGLILVLPVIVILVFFGNNLPGLNKQNLQKNNSETSKNILQEQEVKPEIKTPEIVAPNSLGMNTLFFGDVFWGRYVDDWSKASSLKFAYPFSGLSSFNRENYQAWIANLECPITTTYLNSATQDNLLKFSCPTEYTAEAAKWFNAFTLANNHMDNMEEVNGLAQTRQNLEANKIQYFGHFDNSFRDENGEDEICEVVALPSKPNFPTPQENQVSDNSEFLVPVALCGFHNVFKLPTEADLAVIEKYSSYLPTIAMPHQGKEYTLTADQLQQTYSKKMIDLGADVIIGNHTHSVQNTEAYKGKLIIYSMGNFIFDQQTAPLYRQGLAVNLNFNFEMDENMSGWSKLAPTCLKFKDDCLKQAKMQNLTKPKFSLEVNLIPTDNSNKLAKKADELVASKVLSQAKWDQTKAGLDYSYARK